jgi:DNA polymerase III alpha subunit
MKACAITDYGNMYGAISFYNNMKANGIHPIIGYEAILTSAVVSIKPRISKRASDRIITWFCWRKI